VLVTSFTWVEVHEHQSAVLHFRVVVTNVSEVYNVVTLAIFHEHWGPCGTSAETYDERDAPCCKEEKRAPVCMQ
jgi:hypothetical protein